MNLEPLIHEIFKNCKDALIGGVGGLVAYLYHFSQSRHTDPSIRIDAVAFLINGIVGAFMAYCFGDLVSDSYEYRDGIIGLIGVMGFGLMGAIESKFLDSIINKFFK